MSGIIQQFPQRGTSFQDPNGVVNSVWYRTLLAMWTRTGGGTSDASIAGLQSEITTLDAAKVAKAGSTMTGQLILPGTPGSSLGATPKSYVDASISTAAALVLPLAGGTMTGPIIGPVYTVTTLPVAVAGARAFVTDATVTTFASAVVGSGTNKVPVYSDGTVWRIG